MTDEQRRVTLLPGVLEVIKAVTADATLSPSQRLTGALLMVWGWAWYEDQTQVDPTKLALPSAQWQEICGYLTQGVPGDKIANVNLGLDWMNRGPSAFED